MGDFESFIPDVHYFVYRKCFPNWVIEKSIIDFHDLTYILSGKGTYCVNTEEFSVSAGDIVYIPPGKIREAWTSAESPMQIFAMNFKLIQFGETNNGSLLPFQFVNHIGVNTRLIYLYKQLTCIWMEKKDLYRIEVRARALQIISELIRRLYYHTPVAFYDERIEKVKDYINENYYRPLTASELANQAGLNAVYLGALFKKCESFGIKEYMNKIRISHARDILHSKQLTVSEVAYMCGFTDAFYFCRVFKKYTGLTPSAISRRG